MSSIKPSRGVVLVDLIPAFGDIPTVQKSHDSLTSGKVIAVNKYDEKDLLGCTAFWRLYKDDARLPGNLALIEIKDILGYEEPPSNNG